MTSNKVPSSLKHNVWILYIGEKFNNKCTVTWCNNNITPFTFEAGHNIPFSKGGATTIDNLRPICSDCNKSMGNRYTIDEYSTQFNTTTPNPVTESHTKTEPTEPTEPIKKEENKSKYKYKIWKYLYPSCIKLSNANSAK